VILDDTGLVLLSGGEHELGRWMIFGTCLITVASDGRPLQVAEGESRGMLVPAVAEGAGVFCLTPRRIVGTFVAGKIGGSVAFKGEQSMAVEFPLGEIASVSVLRTRTLLGGRKAVGITIHAVGDIPGVLRLDIDSEIDLANRRGRKYRDQATVARSIAAAAAAVRGVAVPEFVEDDGDLTAELDMPGASAGTRLAPRIVESAPEGAPSANPSRGLAPGWQRGLAISAVAVLLVLTAANLGHVDVSWLTGRSEVITQGGQRIDGGVRLGALLLASFLVGVGLGVLLQSTRRRRR
jgi:hypothetical protein